jgi:hypothetical protein
MPEAVTQLEVALSREAVWDFVKDMNHWAPMLTGYQKHEIISDTQSRWTLKGDVGILSRTVELEVNITEWSGPDRVRFTLRGLNEAVEGAGTFEIVELTGGPGAAGGAAPPAAAGAAADAAAAAKPAQSWWQRLVERLVRWFLRRQHTPALPASAAPPAAAPASAPASGARSALSFTLMMEAGGPTGPLVNAMLEPALIPATEDLATRIVEHLRRTHGLA